MGNAELASYSSSPRVRPAAAGDGDDELPTLRGESDSRWLAQRSSEGVRGRIPTPHVAQSSRHFTCRGEGGERRFHWNEDVVGALSRSPQGRQGTRYGGCVAVASQGREALALLSLQPRVKLQGMIRLLLVHHEAVDSNHGSLTGINLASYRIGRTLDFALLESLFDGGHRSPTLLHCLYQGPSCLLEIVGQRFDGVRTRERVNCLGYVGLVRENLLGPQSQPSGRGCRQTDGLVIRVRVQRLGAAKHSCQCLERHPGDIHLRLLSRQLDTCSLGMKTEHL